MSSPYVNKTKLVLRMNDNVDTEKTLEEFTVKNLYYR